MKVALLSDIHIHNWREFNTPGSDGIPVRLMHCIDTLNDIRRYCVEHGIGVVVLGGDLFHKRGVLFTQAYNLTVNALIGLRDSGVTVFAVDGNHDHATKSGSVHVVEALAATGLVKSIDIAFGFENWHISSDDNSDTLVITGVSYCDSADVFDQRLTAAEEEYRTEYKGESRIFVFHHGFQGARVGTALEYQVREEIDSKRLDDYTHDFAYSGHYHTRQAIGGRANAMYIGSPLEHMRGDAGTVKGFQVYNSITKQSVLVPLNRPRFVVLTQEMLDDKDYTIVKGNFVDVACEDMPKNPDAFRDLLRKHGALGVHFAPKRKLLAKTAARLDIDLSMDSKTVLEKYIAHTNPDVDHDALLRVGTELLDKAIV